MGRRCPLPERRRRRRGRPICDVCPVTRNHRGSDTDLGRRGHFADSFGEDFLGLRELGIEAEFGLQSLAIPKKLLKGKKQGQVDGPSAYVPHSYALDILLLTTGYQCKAYRTTATVSPASSIRALGLEDSRHPDWLAQSLLPRAIISRVCTTSRFRCSTVIDASRIPSTYTCFARRRYPIYTL